jgi:integrase
MVRRSAKRDRTAEVLTADELKAWLTELAGVYRVMLLVAVTTGLRVSELLGLRWLDCDFEDGEIHQSLSVLKLVVWCSAEIYRLREAGSQPQ